MWGLRDGSEQLLQPASRYVVKTGGRCGTDQGDGELFRTLKCEEVYLWEYRTLEDARISIESFIEAVYNKKRLHSSLGYVPPEEFEMLHAMKTGNSQTILTQAVQN